MGRKIKIDDEQVVEAAKVNKGQFTVYKAGTYNFTIFDAEAKTYGERSKNAGKEFYQLVLKFNGGEYDGKKMTRVQVPLFQNWSVSTDPTKAAKNPKGWPTVFAPFFQALGYEVKGNFEIPEPGEILGKELSAKVGIEDDTYGLEQAVREGDTEAKQEDYKRNNVSKFGPPIEGLGEGSADEKVSGGFNL